jgi:hypothetical protein
MVTVSINAPREAIVDDSWQHWTTEARRAVQACLSAETEMLLPQMGPVRARDCALVLTSATDAEVAALASRIQAACDGLELYEKVGLSCTVSSSLLETAPVVGETPSKKRVETVSKRITQHIGAATKARAA